MKSLCRALSQSIHKAAAHQHWPRPSTMCRTHPCAGNTNTCTSVPPGLASSLPKGGDITVKGFKDSNCPRIQSTHALLPATLTVGNRSLLKRKPRWLCSWFVQDDLNTQQDCAACAKVEAGGAQLGYKPPRLQAQTRYIWGLKVL